MELGKGLGVPRLFVWQVVGVTMGQALCNWAAAMQVRGEGGERGDIRSQGLWHGRKNDSQREG